MIKKLALAGAVAIAAGAVALPANAADLPPMAPVAPAPAPAPAFSWNGLYVGTYFEGQFVTTAGFVPTWWTFLGGGVRAGYNYQAGSFVVGVEGGLEYSVNTSGPFPLANVTDAGIVGRAGIAMGRTLLFGVAGGGAMFNGTTTPYWTVGAGIEAMLTDALSVRADYRYQYAASIGPGWSHNFGVGFSFYVGR